MVNNVQEFLIQKMEDQAKDNEELKKIEIEQKSGVGMNLSNKMKEQCIGALGAELYNKLYDCIRKLRKNGIKNYEQSEEYKILANDKEKKNKAFNIDQIIEIEDIKEAII